MSKKFIISFAFGLALVVAPLTSMAGGKTDTMPTEHINIYGWQDWSFEFVDADGGKSVDRFVANAANIGFNAQADTGHAGVAIGFKCEQYTYFNNADGGGEWCNRNSKISLIHETAGEIMYAHWLLPYNEIVAQWIDFQGYDANITSHTGLMGKLGGSQVGGGGYYVGSFGDYGRLSFNRRQKGIIQYVWPNASAMASQSRDGFQFRIAVTEGSITDVKRDIATLDPRIISTGVSYQQMLGNGHQFWVAAAYEQHEDWSIAPGSSYGGAFAQTCADSDDSGQRLAGRYVANWGDGQKTIIATMFEQLEYEASGCDFTGITTGLGTTAFTNAERDIWMIAFKQSFGNGFDFRASYYTADDIECGNAQACSADQAKDTGADAYNFGIHYTPPGGGTELSITFATLSNDTNAQYDFGINGAGATKGGDVNGVSFGVVHWFD